MNEAARKVAGESGSAAGQRGRAHLCLQPPQPMAKPSRVTPREHQVLEQTAARPPGEEIGQKLAGLPVPRAERRAGTDEAAALRIHWIVSSAAFACGFVALGLMALSLP